MVEYNKLHSEDMKKSEYIQPLAKQNEGQAAQKDQQLKQWLHKVKDDPGRLLRNKMLRAHKRNMQNPEVEREIW